MSDQHEHSETLSRDLGTLTRSPIEVPEALDAEIRDSIRAHFVANQPKRSSFAVLKLVPWAGAAAAVIAVMVVLTQQGRQPELLGPTVLVGRDVDGNGRVDILDAFALARWVEDGRTLDATMDFNGDGAVDRLDADDIATHAVSLEQGAS